MSVLANLFLLLTLNVLGMTICYTMERSVRREFDLTRKLKIQWDDQIKAGEDLKATLEEVKVLRGYLPICASCKKIRNDEGYWQQVEDYLTQNTDAHFTHGICSECKSNLYPGVFDGTDDQGDINTQGTT